MKKFFLYFFGTFAGLIALTVLFFAGRQLLARMQVEREWQVIPTSIPNLETTSHLEILPIYEADGTSENFVMGHGVSYLIRTDSATILMDLGYNPDETPTLPALQNMQTMGISLEDLDAIIISHPHPDHVGGVQAWQNKTISLGDYAGSLGDMPIYVPIPMTFSSGKIIYSPEPTLISKDIATTGTISYPEVFPVYLFSSKGQEQGLVINVAGEGLVMITGCGHPTMERLVSRAETLFGQPVIGVVGGLHYEQASQEKLQPHIQFLESRQPKLVALSPHDSSPEVLKAFETAFPDAYQFVHVGETIQFP